MKTITSLSGIVLLLMFNIAFTACKKNEALPPVACFTASQQNVKPNVEVQFFNCSSNATRYEWDFGDGSKSTDASPIKAYATNGTYNVLLTVTNSKGVKATGQNTIVVKDCALGYEGDDCTLESRVKFLGTYRVLDTAAEGGLRFYFTTLSIASSNHYSVLVNKVWEDFYANPVLVTISGNTFTIPEQDPDNDNYIIKGSGTLNNNSITINYRITAPNTTQLNIKGTWTRQ